MASILIVDDEPSIRRPLRLTHGPDHQIGEAADGVEALRSLRASPQDIAIVDVTMPVMDGLAVCRADRAEPSLARVGIIVSAYADAGAVMAAGADGHLRKPFRPLELLALVDEVLARRSVEACPSEPDESRSLAGRDLPRSGYAGTTRLDWHALLGAVAGDAAPHERMPVGSSRILRQHACWRQRAPSSSSSASSTRSQRSVPPIACDAAAPGVLDRGRDDEPSADCDD